MDILLAIITEIVDAQKFVIKFSIEGIIDNMIAYPIEMCDEPNIGDPIICYGIESILGYSYVYKKQRILDYTRLKLGNSEIDIQNEGVLIATRDGSTITVSSDGDVLISSKGSIDIDSAVNVTISAPQITTPAGGTVSGSPGPFCAIPICPVLNVPHTGNVVAYPTSAAQ